MAVELGSGYVSIVASAKGIRQSLFDEVEKPAKEAGENAGKQASDGFGSKFDISAFMVGAGLAAGAVLAKGIFDGMNQEASTDRLAASLGLSEAEAAKLGAATAEVYSNAYGDSFESVGEVARTALAIDTTAGQDAIEEMTIKALDLEAAFGGAGSEYLTFGSQLVNQGITDGIDESLDYITTAFQQIPTELQGPLQDALSEYAPFLQDIGFSTEETFALLTSAAAEGEFQLDKTGDALKEFGIRATDGSAASSEAYEAIGLNAEEMANRLLAGGETANGAFDEIVAGLLDIEDPAERANAAIALFGTPLEDLGVNGIPQFLESLSAAPEGFDDVTGAATLMGDTLNDNLSTQIETFKRQALQGLADVATEYVIPALERIGPIVRGVVEAFQTGEVTEGGFVGFLQEAAIVAAEVVDYFVEHWPEIQAVIEEVATAAIEIIGQFVELGLALWNEFGDEATAIVQAFGEFVVPFITGVFDVISGVLDVFIGLFTGDWSRMWEGIKSIVSGAVTVVKATVKLAFETLKTVIGGILEAIKTVVSNAWDAIVSGVSGLGGRIKSAASGIFDGVKDAFRSAINWIIDKWNALSFTVPAVDLGPLGEFGGGTFGTPDIPRLHTGGLVPGLPGQEVPAILLAGERVLSPEQTRAYDSGRGAGVVIENYNTQRPLLEEMAEFNALYAVGV